jgi:hypothetical protein
MVSARPRWRVLQEKLVRKDEPEEPPHV